MTSAEEPQRQPSQTALGTAYLRAVHQLLDKPPRILEDPFAVPLLGLGALQRILSAPQTYQTPERVHLRAHVVLRSRFAEDRLAAAAARGVTQYVLLGAGFDTFALRQPPWARPLRIYEIDHAATQSAKRGQLSAAGLVLPPNVTLGAVDFEREALDAGLRRHGVAADQPTFFSWLGVSMYLDEAAIDLVLATVAAFPAGSEIVLTFAAADAPPSRIADRAASVGEPWKSRFEPECLEAKLRATGFSEVGFLSREEADERYFRNRPQDLPLPRRTGLAHAIR